MGVSLPGNRSRVTAQCDREDLKESLSWPILEWPSGRWTARSEPDSTKGGQGLEGNASPALGAPHNRRANREPLVGRAWPIAIVGEVSMVTGSQYDRPRSRCRNQK